MISGKLVTTHSRVARKDAFISTRIWKVSRISGVLYASFAQYAWDEGVNKTKIERGNLGFHGHKSPGRTEQYARNQRNRNRKRGLGYVIVRGSIAQFGLVKQHTDGYRSSKAEILEVKLPRSAAHLRAAVAQQYPSVKVTVN